MFGQTNGYSLSKTSSYGWPKSLCEVYKQAAQGHEWAGRHCPVIPSLGV